MLLYGSLAQYYDAIEKRTRAVRSDIPFLKAIFEKDGVRKVLDVGCGTGLHTHLLASCGYEVVGIDKSPDMLEVARRRRRDALYIERDMRDFSFDAGFDAAISMYGSINYLVEDEDIEAAFGCIRETLCEGGVFILEVWNAIPLVMKFGKDETVDALVDQGAIRITRRKGYSLEKGEGIKVRVDYSYTIRGEVVRTSSESHIVRSFFVKEMARFLENCGFRVAGVYNNTKDMREFSLWSNRMVIVAQLE